MGRNCMDWTSKDLRAKFRVRNRVHDLSVKRPVRVITYAAEDAPQEIICGTRETVDRTMIPPHQHEYYELTLCLEDGGIHETQTGRTPIKRGAVIAMAPGEVHGFRPAGTGRGSTVVCNYLAEWLYPDVRELLDELEFISLFLHKTLFGEIRRVEVPQWHVDEEVLEACLREFQDIGLECERQEPSHSFLRLCLKKAMVRLFRAYKCSAPIEPFVAEEPLLRSALLHIEDCILQCTPFRVSALAEELRLGADSFSKFFKEATGSNPMDYYQHRRLQQACSLLLGTSRSLTEIAHALGYCDSAHFSHLFKRYYGTTPSGYRRNFGR